MLMEAGCRPNTVRCGRLALRRRTGLRTAMAIGPTSTITTAGHGSGTSPGAGRRTITGAGFGTADTAGPGGPDKLELPLTGVRPAWDFSGLEQGWQQVFWRESDGSRWPPSRSSTPGGATGGVTADGSDSAASVETSLECTGMRRSAAALAWPLMESLDLTSGDSRSRVGQNLQGHRRFAAVACRFGRLRPVIISRAGRRCQMHG